MKQIITFFFVFITTLLTAQQSIKVTYAMQRTFPNSFFDKFPESTKEDMRKEFAKPLYTTIINNGMNSLAENVASKDVKILSKEIQVKNTVNEGIIIPFVKSWKLKNFNDQTQLVLISINDKKYYIKKPLLKPNVIFINGEETIDGYICKKAYSIDLDKKSDTIRYWYTTKIPVDDGPKDEVGFPGLVLKRQSKYGVEYAVKIEFLNNKFEIEQPDLKIPVITNDEYSKLLKESQLPKKYTDEFGRKIETTTIKLGKQ